MKTLVAVHEVRTGRACSTHLFEYKAAGDPLDAEVAIAQRQATLEGKPGAAAPEGCMRGYAHVRSWTWHQKKAVEDEVATLSTRLFAGRRVRAALFDKRGDVRCLILEDA